MRAAVPTVKGSPNAEKLIHLVPLAQIQAEHLSNNGQDIRPLTSEQMQRNGVPIKRGPKISKYRRPDVTFVNARVASTGIGRREAYALWSEMTPEERGRAVATAATESQEYDDGGAEIAEEPDASEQVPSIDSVVAACFECGSHETPLRADVVEEFMAR
eukprot:3501608-Karenia_brevis.AAC.1